MKGHGIKEVVTIVCIFQEEGMGLRRAREVLRASQSRGGSNIYSPLTSAGLGYRSRSSSAIVHGIAGHRAPGSRGSELRGRHGDASSPGRPLGARPPAPACLGLGTLAESRDREAGASWVDKGCSVATFSFLSPHDHYHGPAIPRRGV